MNKYFYRKQTETEYTDCNMIDTHSAFLYKSENKLDISFQLFMIHLFWVM